jgi:hypothetical protein
MSNGLMEALVLQGKLHVTPSVQQVLGSIHTSLSDLYLRRYRRPCTPSCEGIEGPVPPPAKVSKALYPLLRRYRRPCTPSCEGIEGPVPPPPTVNGGNKKRNFSGPPFAEKETNAQIVARCGADRSIGAVTVEAKYTDGSLYCWLRFLRCAAAIRSNGPGDRRDLSGFSKAYFG